MSQKAAAVSAPELIHHKGEQFPNSVLILEKKATQEISCNVMIAVSRQAGVGFRITSAVRYESGGAWYAKDVQTCFTLPEAIKRAYGMSRKLYKLTSSRALAGLLHDSVVPATDDIDF